MKTTLLIRLFASVVLALGLTAVNAAPISLEEVKVGSTVTSEGIGIGWGKYLPMPEGEWEVVVRDDMTYDAGKSSAPVYYIQLLNKDEKSPLQLLQIKFHNPAGRITPEVNCPEKNTLLFDRMGTLEGQNFQLCKLIFKPITYKQNFVNVRSKDENLINKRKSDRDYINERFGSTNPEMLSALIQSGKKGSNRLSYRFGFKLEQLLVDGNHSSVRKINDWLSNCLTKVDSYYSVSKINFGVLKLD